MKPDARKHVARFLARLYPSRWRKRYGAEFDALLEDASSKPHDAFDILWGAFRMQISTWTFGRITLACPLLGVLASVVISFAWPASYVSEAKIKMTPKQVPESGGPAAVNQEMWDRVASINQEILSRNTLTAIIQRYDLYPRERTRMPLHDVVEMMHKEILIAPLVPANSHNRVIPAFVIEFSYPDAHLAQQVTSDLTSRFIDANVRQAITDRDINPQSGMQLEALDVASLPTRPSGRNSAMLAAAAVGLFAGLLAGLALAFVIRSRRRITA